ncbi:hypothetical protein [Sanguibacter sp. Z1732]|uniref:hypothetical protein n=1 Tax=Sanguibacter sp. Z1732 TaxID=3435412 RepID=UPI003D9C9B85
MTEWVLNRTSSDSTAKPLPGPPVSSNGVPAAIEIDAARAIAASSSAGAITTTCAEAK